MPGLHLSDWGPAAWNTLHAFAHTAPETLDADAQRDWEAFLRLFAARIPCRTCRTHFGDFLQRRLTPDALATRATLVALLNDAHNEVNARRGKRVYSLREHYVVYALDGAGHRSAVNTVLVVLGTLVAAHAVARLARSKINFVEPL